MQDQQARAKRSSWFNIMTKCDETNTDMLRPFLPAAADPLFAEHEKVGAWVDAALAADPVSAHHQSVDLKALPQGQVILRAKPDESLRLLRAAIARLTHFDAESTRLAATLAPGQFRSSMPCWKLLRGHYQQTEAIVQAMLRRSLPLAETD